MFDNPEKLFIILIIALFIFGPQKLIGLGGAMGRALRDFRGAVRDAQDQFSSAAAEVQEEIHKTEQSLPQDGPAALPPPEWSALPVPEPVSSSIPQAGDTAPAPAVSAGPEPDPEDRDSLASEPSSHAVMESLQESLQRKG